jgi:hypothetical protein
MATLLKLLQSVIVWLALYRELPSRNPSLLEGADPADGQYWSIAKY